MRSFLDNMRLALGTLRANPLRSLLTLLGIVIGVVTVVGMMSLTEGFRVKVNDSLANLGAGAFQVQKWPAFGFGHRDWQKYARRKNLTRDHGDAIKAHCPSVGWVSIEAYPPPEKVSTRERQTRPNITICGGNADYERANGATTERGRFLSDIDVELSRRVAVIGADVADVLFPGEDALGKDVRLRGRNFEVIGVLERMGSNMGGNSRDALVVIPISSFEPVYGKSHNINIAIAPLTPELQATAQDEVIRELRKLRGIKDGDEEDFEIYSNESVTGTFNQFAAIIAAATFGVCALALLVGGIGIMNIMLVSVTERTREIGVRRALGARRRRILAQFVIESVTLSLLGGIIGVLLGAGLAIGVRALTPLPTSIPAWAVVLSLACASGCGLVFGIYPAMRASRLDPVEAMRTE